MQWQIKKANKKEMVAHIANIKAKLGGVEFILERKKNAMYRFVWSSGGNNDNIWHENSADMREHSDETNDLTSCAIH